MGEPALLPHGMIPAIEPTDRAQEDGAAISLPTAQGVLQMIAAGKGVAVDPPDLIGQKGRVPATAPTAEVLVGRIARMALAAAMVRVEALQINRADRILLKIIADPDPTDRIARVVLTGRVLGGPAPDLRGQDLMALLNDAAVMAAPAMLDQWVRRAMANKHDKKVRDRTIRDRGLEVRHRIAAVARRSRSRDSVECRVLAAVLGGSVGRIVNGVIAKIAMDVPVAAGQCGPKLDSLGATGNGANVAPAGQVVPGRADLAR